MSRKSVGAAVLASPGNFTQEQKDASSGAPLLPEGMNGELLKKMMALVGNSDKHGYDQTKHYRELFSRHFTYLPHLLV